MESLSVFPKWTDSSPEKGAFEHSDSSHGCFSFTLSIDFFHKALGGWIVTPTGDLGLGNFTTVSELTLADSDDDGLVEVQLVDGSWVEWSAAAEDFTIH